MTCAMAPNGTITEWKHGTVPILFPEQMMTLKGTQKQRGGAPVCCPNFGTAPTDGPYAGITLPQHGLVRLCTKHDNGVCTYQDLLTSGHGNTAHFSFTKPWTFDVNVDASHSARIGQSILHHSIRLTSPEQTIPFSIGFHPYFATYGEQFYLITNNKIWSKETFPVDEPLFITAESASPVIRLETVAGYVHVFLRHGYTHVVLWSDRPEHYICIEPVCRGEDIPYKFLDAGDHITCGCSVIFVPH